MASSGRTRWLIAPYGCGGNLRMNWVSHVVVAMPRPSVVMWRQACLSRVCTIPSPGNLGRTHAGSKAHSMADDDCRDGLALCPDRGAGVRAELSQGPGAPYRFDACGRRERRDRTTRSRWPLCAVGPTRD